MRFYALRTDFVNNIILVNKEIWRVSLIGLQVFAAILLVVYIMMLFRVSVVCCYSVAFQEILEFLLVPHLLSLYSGVIETSSKYKFGCLLLIHRRAADSLTPELVVFIV